MPLTGYQTQTDGTQIQSTGNRASSAPLQAAQNSSLLQKLQATEERLYKNRAAQAEKTAGDQALVDSGKYKQQVAEIQAKYLGVKDKSSMNQELEKVKSKRFVAASNIYGNAYNNKFDAAYADEISLDVNEKSKLALIAAKGDANSYSNLMDSYEKEMTASAPNQALSTFTKMSYKKANVDGFAKLSLKSNADTFARDKKMSEDNIIALTDIYAQNFQQGTNVDQGINVPDLLSKANAAIDSAVKRGFMTGPMGISAKLNVLKQGQTQLIKADYIKSTRTGEEHIYVDALLKNEDNLRLFSPSELNKIVSDIKVDMTTRNNLANAQDVQAKIIHDKRAEQTVQDLQKAQVYGTLNQEQVDEAYKMNYISQAEADSWYSKINEGMTKGENKEEELKYRAAIVAYSNEEILNNESMNNSQKIALLQFKEQSQSGSGKWTTTVEGKNAIERIKNNWKELMVTMPGMPVNKRTIEDFNSVYNEYMNTMLKLKDNERVARAIPYADAALAAYKEKEFERKRLNTQLRSEKVSRAKEATLEGNAQSYRDRLSEKNKGYYDKGVASFRTSFGNTGLINFGGSNGDVEW